MRRWEGLSEEYVTEGRTRGLAESTLKTWTNELAKFGAWVRRRKPQPALEEVDGDLIVRYIRKRTAFKARSTVASVVSTLRGMGEFLVRRSVWQANPLQWIKGPKLDPRMRLPRRIGASQLTKLWDTAASLKKDYRRHRLMCMLSILYGTGLRRGELTRLSLDDWDREASLIMIDGNKTGRERAIPVGEGVWRCIEAYLPYRYKELQHMGMLQEKSLFVNRYGKRLPDHAITNQITRLCRKADVPRINCHQFRHSCASDLLENGVNLPQVQQFLGHAVVQTTMRYMDISDPKRREAIEKHPINEILDEAKPEERRER